MNKSFAAFILLLVVILTLPIFFITIPILFIMYNSLIKKRNQLDHSFSGIDVILKKRSDLIPNLVSSVKKIMTQEQELFEKITKLRTAIMNQKDDNQERFGLENELSQLMGSINVNMENYPELKSHKNMISLQRSLNETEEQISAARRAYNSTVISFNNGITTIPNNVLAACLSFKEQAYFQVDEVDRENPNINSLFE